MKQLLTWILGLLLLVFMCASLNTSCGVGITDISYTNPTPTPTSIPVALTPLPTPIIPSPLNPIALPPLPSQAECLNFVNVDYADNPFRGWPGPVVGVSAPFCGALYAINFGRTHGGIDLLHVGGSELVATADSLVVSAGWHDGMGYYVMLRSSNGYTALYMHLNDVPLVSTGNSVSNRQLIGYSGTSGSWSEGYHLHYELWRPDHIRFDPCPAMGGNC